MISYYDLLGMVKEGKAPERISVEIVKGTSRIYKAEYDMGKFNFYRLEDDLEDESYRDYLTDCFLESDMFEKCIIILDEEKIEDLNTVDYQYSVCPTFKEKTEAITIMNNNFELHHRAIRDIIENQKKIIERLENENN